MHQVATGSGAAHPFIIPLTKIDVARRLVIGTAAEEIGDKSGEIMDYATARPQFEAWSDGFKAMTGGLSKGNLRVMHTKTVAGRLDDINYDDVTRKVQIVAKVVDDAEWAKVESGCYTGFSIGGGYLKKWKDPESGLTRYTPIVREISLVDNPCMPTATFAELVKADGMVEQLELRGVPHTFASRWAERPRTFAEMQADRPRTFGEMTKASGIHADWSESKHPRSKGGKFASSAGGGDAPAEGADVKPKSFLATHFKPLSEEEMHAEDAKFDAEQEAEAARPKRHQIDPAIETAAAGAGYLGGTAITGAGKGLRAAKHAARFGFGERGKRNETAHMLRGNPELRAAIKSRAHKARVDAIDSSPTAQTMGDTARRKVMEEAKARGSSAAEASAQADKFAAKLAGRKDTKTVGELFHGSTPGIRVSAKTATNATRAAKNALRGGVLSAKHVTQQVGAAINPRTMGRTALLGRFKTLPFKIAGGILGAQAAHRLQREEDGDPVTRAQHIGANVGEALRTVGHAAQGAFPGMIAAGVGSFFHQGGSIRNKQAFLASIPKLNQMKLMQHANRGAIAGMVLSGARTLPGLISEYRARREGKEA